MQGLTPAFPWLEYKNTDRKTSFLPGLLASAWLELLAGLLDHLEMAFGALQGHLGIASVRRFERIIESRFGCG